MAVELTHSCQTLEFPYQCAGKKVSTAYSNIKFQQSLVYFESGTPDVNFSAIYISIQ